MKPKNLLELMKRVLEGNGDSWENVVAVWVGDHGWEWFDDNENGRRISKEEAERLFSADPAGSGYGGEECWNFHVYTKDHVLFKACYDGSEWVEIIPLNPDKPRKPYSIGG